MEVDFDTFDYKTYLNIYPDIYKAFQNIEDVVELKLKCWKHWNAFGRSEGRTYQIIKNEVTFDTFDHEKYLDMYPDVRESLKTIDNKKLKAWSHWNTFGHLEGRKIFKCSLPTILVIFHIGYSHNLDFYLDTIKNIILNKKYKFYLHCTICNNIYSDNIINKIYKLNNFVNIYVNKVDNYGADTLPFLKYISNTKENYDYIIKLHTKTTSYWTYKLLSTFSDLDHLMDKFKEDSTIGIIGSRHYLQPFYYGLSEVYKSKLSDFVLKEGIYKENIYFDYIKDLSKHKVPVSSKFYKEHRDDIPRNWNELQCQEHFNEHCKIELIKSGYDVNRADFLKFIAGTMFIIKGNIITKMRDDCATLKELELNVDKIKYYSNFDHNGTMFRYTNAYEYLLQVYIYKFGYRVYGIDSDHLTHSIEIKNKCLPCKQILNTTKPSILFISNELSLTGAPLAMKNIIKTLLDTYDIYLISLYGGDDINYYNSLLGKDKVTIIYKDHTKCGIDVYKKLCQYCCNYINIIKPYVVYANTLVSTFGLYGAKLSDHKCKTILHIHEADDEIFNLYNSNIIIGYEFLNKVDELICVNDYLLQWCKEYLNTNIFPRHNVIYNEINVYELHIDKTTFFNKYNIPINKTIIGGVGSINYRKGFDIFYELTELYPDFTFVWASNQTTTDAKNYLHCNTLPKNIHIIKLNNNEMGSFYKNIDCFLCTSRSESFSLTLFESLLSNKYVFFHKTTIPFDPSVYLKIGVEPFDGHYNIDNFKKVLDDIKNKNFNAHHYDNKINTQFVKSLVQKNIDKIVNVINNNNVDIHTNKKDNLLPTEIFLHDTLNIYQKFKKYVSSNDDMLKLKFNPNFDNCLDHYMNYGFMEGRSIFRFPNKIKKTILFALHTLDFNGATKVGLDIASHLQNKFNVIIVSWEDGNMIDDYCFENKPIVIKYREFEHDLIKYIDRKELAENIINATNCDLIYVNCSCAHDFYHASIECKKPVIYHNHEGKMGYECELNGFQIPCDNFFNVFPYNRAIYYSPSPETTKCMKNMLGVNLNKVREFQSINFKNMLLLSKQPCSKIKRQNRLLFGMIGGCFYRKGYDMFKEIAKHYPEHDFCWVGCDISTEIVKETDNLFLIKKTANPYKYLVQFDHFLCTTREDIFGLVIIESLYFNIPCHYIKQTIPLTEQFEEIGSFSYECSYNINSFKNIVNNIHDKKSNDYKKIIENKYDVQNHIVSIENDIINLMHQHYRPSSTQNYYYDEEYGYCIYDVSSINNIITKYHEKKPFDVEIYKKKYKNLSYVFSKDDEYKTHWDKIGNTRLNMEVHDWKTYLSLHPEKVKEGIIKQEQIDFEQYKNIIVDFNPEKYLQKYVDLHQYFNKNTVINHWKNNGIWEGR